MGIKKTNRMGMDLRDRTKVKGCCVCCCRNPLLTVCVILVLLVTLGGCSKKSYFPSFNPPKYVLNSGVLKLERTLTVPRGDGARTMFFSHNGRYLVAVTRKSLHYNIWDMETGKLIYQINRYRKDDKGWVKLPGRFGRYSNNFSFSSPGGMFLPDDSALLLPKYGGYFPVGVKNIAPVSEGYHASSDYSYFYLAMDNLDLMRPALSAEMSQESWEQGSFSPDGNYFAVPGKTSVLHQADYGKASFLKLYRTSDWKLVAERKGGFASGRVWFTPDSKYVVDHERVGNDSGWLPGKGVKSVSPFDGETYFGDPIKKDYNEKLEEYAYPEIRFWSVPDLKLEKTIDNVFRGWIETFGSPRNLSLSPDGRLVALSRYDYNVKDGFRSRDKGLLRVFSVESGILVHELADVVAGVYFSRNNQFLVAVGSWEPMAVRIYSTKDWQLKEHVKFEKDSAWPLSWAFNVESNRLAYSNGNLIYIWKVAE